MRRVRTKEPVREQGMFRWEMPEDALSAGHPARLLWQVLGTLDPSGFIQTRGCRWQRWRDVPSVRMLLTLWLYAISIGIGSAREIARRIQSDAALRWIVGDQSVGHAKRRSSASVISRSSTSCSLTSCALCCIGSCCRWISCGAGRDARTPARRRLRFVGRPLVSRPLDKGAPPRRCSREADDPEATEAEKLARLAAAIDYKRRVD